MPEPPSSSPWPSRATGEQIAAAAIPNRYQTFPDGGAEQDMARTWADTAATLKELTEKIPNLADRLIAISVTGQGDGMWLIDKAGEPVAPAWLWLDARAAAITEAFARKQGLSRALQAHRHRRERLPDEHAARLDDAEPAGGAGPRHNGLPLQGLALFQAHGRPAHRPVGGQFHLRPICHPHLCAGRAGCARRLRCEAAAAGDRGRHRKSRAASRPRPRRSPA